MSATRARAPGGSFICPYTSVHFDSAALSPVLITPDSIISRYRSLPCVCHTLVHYGHAQLWKVYLDLADADASGGPQQEPHMTHCDCK